MLSIDLNCDLGEGTGADDLGLLEVVTSANIACGGHAGDEETMTRTVANAEDWGVAVGAHPGYPDRANFGRVALDLSDAEIERSVYEQVAALDRIPMLMRLQHVKLHGALYHKAMTDEPTAMAAARAVGRWIPAPLSRNAMYMVAMPATRAHDLWQSLGFSVLTEFFADRVYEADGSLRNRTLPGALITDPGAAASQAVAIAKQIAKRRPVRLPPLPPSSPLIWADHSMATICIHSDTPNAPAIAAAVRAALEQTGVRVCAPSRSEP